jgi:DNA-binding LacI/PurR family transcriptional regulator
MSESRDDRLSPAPDRAPGRVNVNTVADAARVSRQTVTNALRHPERVRPETLSRVHAEIVRLGYRPSSAAQSLQAQRAGAIGVELNALGADYHNAVMAPFVAALTLAAPGRSFHMVTFGSPTHTPTLESYQQLWRGRVVDAFVLADTHYGDPRPAWLRDQGIPFSSFGRIWDDPGFARWVDVDGHHGTGLAVAHCVEAGYDAIGYLGSPAGVSVVADARRAGWQDACRAAGRQPGPDLSGPDELDAVRRVADEAVAAVGVGGAVVCATDVLAVGALHAAWRAGLTPGADLGIVGFDDSELARMHGLTSVSQSLDEVARLALALVAEALAGSDGGRSDGVLLRPGLTARASTARPHDVSGTTESQEIQEEEK